MVLKDQDRFASALAERLLMFAVSRNVQYYDAPAVRKIVREAKAGGYRFSDLVLGVAKSAPFEMRTVKPKTTDVKGDVKAEAKTERKNP